MVAVGRGERSQECARQRLCQNYDFSPLSAFWVIDRCGRGSVNASDLLDFLREQRNYSATYSECADLVRFFDSDNDGVLGLSDFQQLFLACEDNYIKDRALCRPSSRCCKLPYSVERDLTDVLEGELRLQREVDSLKRSLKYGCDYSAIAAFDSIDSPRIGRIDHYNLKCFLNRTCAYPTDGEVTAIIRRIDLDGDQSLSFSEFDAFLREPYVSPCSPVRQPSPRPVRSASPLRSESKVEASPAK